MKVVFKEVVPIDGQWHRRPYSRELHVGQQGANGQVVFWREVRSGIADAGTAREYRVFGTGHPVEDEAAEYVGTVQASNGLVWHLYRR